MKLTWSNSIPIILTTMILILISFPVYSDSQKRKIIVVGENSPPFEFEAVSREAKGIVVDIWRLWAEKADVDLEYKIMEWSEALKLVREGKADIVSGMFRTHDREMHWDFSDPYYEIPVSIFFNKNIGGISGLEDLAGFKIGVMKDDASVNMVKTEVPEAVVVEFPTWENLVQAAIDERIMVFVADSPQALFYLSKKGAIDKFNRPQKYLKVGKLHGGIKKGNVELLKFVNTNLKKISKEEIEQIQRKWQGENHGHPGDLKNRIIIAAVFLLLIIVSHILILRSKVSRRTKELEMALHEIDAQKERIEKEIRERSLSEKSKEITEKKYENVVESCPMAIFNVELKPGGEMILVSSNKAASEMVGIDYSLRVGLPVKKAFPGISDGTLSNIKRAAEEGIPVKGEVAHYVDSEIDVFADLHIFQNSPMNVTIMASDVTEKIKAKEALVQSQEFLENEIKNRTRELLETNERLSCEIAERDTLQNQLIHSERLAAVGTLAGGVAHEFNNINTGILGFAEMASFSKDPAEVAECLQRVVKCALRAKDITRLCPVNLTL